MNDLSVEVQDYRDLDWAERKLSPGTPGCFLKAYSEQNGVRVYYKLSNYDSYRRVFGHECVNELIVSRLLDILGIPHVSYRLVHAAVNIDGEDTETWISESTNFRKNNEEKLAFDMFYDMEKYKDESPLNFAIRSGWEEYIYNMLCVDYIIANRDRHGGNIEILRNMQSDEVRLAPLFDQGVSLLFSTYGDESRIQTFDVMQDIQANNFIGSRSLEYNLSLIPKDYNMNIAPLKKGDKIYLFQGLEKVLSRPHLDKIWEMIWGRWCCFEALRNKK